MYKEDLEECAEFINITLRMYWEMEGSLKKINFCFR